MKTKVKGEGMQAPTSLSLASTERELSLFHVLRMILITAFVMSLAVLTPLPALAQINAGLDAR